MAPISKPPELKPQAARCDRSAVARNGPRSLQATADRWWASPSRAGNRLGEGHQADLLVRWVRLFW